MMIVNDSWRISMRLITANHWWANGWPWGWYWWWVVINDAIPMINCRFSLAIALNSATSSPLNQSDGCSTSAWPYRPAAGNAGGELGVWCMTTAVSQKQHGNRIEGGPTLPKNHQNSWLNDRCPKICLEVPSENDQASRCFGRSWNQQAEGTPSSPATGRVMRPLPAILCLAPRKGWGRSEFSMALPSPWGFPAPLPTSLYGNQRTQKQPLFYGLAQRNWGTSCAELSIWGMELVCPPKQPTVRSPGYLAGRGFKAQLIKIHCNQSMWHQCTSDSINMSSKCIDKHHQVSMIWILTDLVHSLQPSQTNLDVP